MGLLDRLRTPRPVRRKAGDLRVVAVTRILDECDIVEAFVRHTARYAGHHIFVDNGSRDGTLDILAKLRDEGFGITVWQNKSVSFNEISFNTFMFRQAVTVQAADWVFCLDADEFIDDRQVEGGLLRALAALVETKPELPCINLPMREYRTSAADVASDVIVPTRIRRRAEATDNIKVCISGRLPLKGLTVQGGNHFVHRGAERLEGIRIPGLFLAHFAYRSPYQGLAKFAKGWAKVLAAGPDEIAQGTSYHYKGYFETLCAAPQALLRNDDAFFATPPNLHLAEDPIAYRGGPLRFTEPTDEAMRAIRMVMGYLDELATRHGLLVHNSAQAKQLVDTWNADLKLVLG